MLGIEKLFGGSPGHQGTLAAIAQVLQASGPQRMPQSLYGILGGGLMAGQQVAQQAREQEMVTQLRQQQIEGRQLDLQGARDARTRQQQTEEAARGAQGVGGFDTEGFLGKLASIDPMKAWELRRSLAKSAPKFDAGITWVNGPDGKPVAVRTADDGSVKQIDGVAPRDKLELENLGGRSVAYNPFALQPGQTFQRTVSPDAQLSAATSMRGQNMTDARAREANDVNRMGQRTQIVNDPVQGPMLVDKGTGQARQVMMGGQPVPGENAAKRAAAAKSLMPLIGQAEKLIDGATGSYLGAAHDQTARIFGRATDGAQNIAQLRVLEGNLMMAQPRMEGPQSNMDVELYRQMAAQIGDPTVPNATKKAALSTLRTLYDKYDSSKPAQQNQSGGVPSDIGALLDKYGGY